MLDLQQYLNMLYFDLYDIVYKISNSIGSDGLRNYIESKGLDNQINISSGGGIKDRRIKIQQIYELFDSIDFRTEIYNYLKNNIRIDADDNSNIINLSEDAFVDAFDDVNEAYNKVNTRIITTLNKKTHLHKIANNVVKKYNKDTQSTRLMKNKICGPNIICKNTPNPNIIMVINTTGILVNNEIMNENAIVIT